MSGRGLGHTGGTVDKFESIPGFSSSLGADDFVSAVNECGLCVCGQSGNLCPADKKLYALRDVTATVDSIPLIASSIMSKKLAGGADCIVLDVKCGSGAFMKDEESAAALASKMVEIGRGAGRKIAALVTDMDVPLGRNIGNSLEIIEAVETLNGNGPSDLREVSLLLCAKLLELAGKGTFEEGTGNVGGRNDLPLCERHQSFEGDVRFQGYARCEEQSLYLLNLSLLERILRTARLQLEST
jgi:pyrimidine-nucleoside phosphorylase